LLDPILFKTAPTRYLSMANLFADVSMDLVLIRLRLSCQCCTRTCAGDIDELLHRVRFFLLAGVAVRSSAARLCLYLYCAVQCGDEEPRGRRGPLREHPRLAQGSRQGRRELGDAGDQGTVADLHVGRDAAVRRLRSIGQKESALCERIRRHLEHRARRPDGRLVP